MILSRRQREQYDRDGFVFPIRVLSAAEVSFFRNALDPLINTSEGSVKRLDRLHLSVDWPAAWSRSRRSWTRCRLFSAIIFWSMALWSYLSRRMIPVTPRGTRTVSIQDCICRRQLRRGLP